MHFRKETWVEAHHGAGGSSSLLFSRADTFDMLDGPSRRLSVAVAALEPGSGTILGVESSGHEIEMTDDTVLTLMLPTAGRVEVDLEAQRYGAAPGQALCFAPSRRRTRVFRPAVGDFSALMLKVPIDDLLRRERHLNRHPFVQIDQAQARIVADLLRYVLGGLEGGLGLFLAGKGSVLAQALVREHLRELIRAAPQATRSASAADVQIVRRAEDFLRAHYFEPLRLEHIAAAAGVGERRLQAAFSAAIGITPWQRLGEIRLAEAHEALSHDRGRRSVTEIAMDCGLFHLGRFSSHYAARYGELPSQTLGRARQRVM